MGERLVKHTVYSRFTEMTKAQFNVKMSAKAAYTYDLRSLRAFQREGRVHQPAYADARPFARGQIATDHPARVRIDRWEPVVYQWRAHKKKADRTETLWEDRSVHQRIVRVLDRLNAALMRLWSTHGRTHDTEANSKKRDNFQCAFQWFLNVRKSVLEHLMSLKGNAVPQLGIIGLLDAWFLRRDIERALALLKQRWQAFEPEGQNMEARMAQTFPSDATAHVQSLIYLDDATLRGVFDQVNLAQPVAKRVFDGVACPPRGAAVDAPSPPAPAQVVQEDVSPRVVVSPVAVEPSPAVQAPEVIVISDDEVEPRSAPEVIEISDDEVEVVEDAPRVPARVGQGRPFDMDDALQLDVGEQELIHRMRLAAKFKPGNRIAVLFSVQRNRPWFGEQAQLGDRIIGPYDLTASLAHLDVITTTGWMSHAHMRSALERFAEMGRPSDRFVHSAERVTELGERTFIIRNVRDTHWILCVFIRAQNTLTVYDGYSDSTNEREVKEIARQIAELTQSSVRIVREERVAQQTDACSCGPRAIWFLLRRMAHLDVQEVSKETLEAVRVKMVAITHLRKAPPDALPIYVMSKCLATQPDDATPPEDLRRVAEQLTRDERDAIDGLMTLIGITVVLNVSRPKAMRLSTLRDPFKAFKKRYPLMKRLILKMEDQVVMWMPTRSESIDGHTVPLHWYFGKQADQMTAKEYAQLVGCARRRVGRPHLLAPPKDTARARKAVESNRLEAEILPEPAVVESLTVERPERQEPEQVIVESRVDDELLLMPVVVDEGLLQQFGQVDAEPGVFPGRAADPTLERIFHPIPARTARNAFLKLDAGEAANRWRWKPQTRKTPQWMWTREPPMRLSETMPVESKAKWSNAAVHFMLERLAELARGTDTLVSFMHSGALPVGDRIISVRFVDMFWVALVRTGNRLEAYSPLHTRNVQEYELQPTFNRGMDRTDDAMYTLWLVMQLLIHGDVQTEPTRRQMQHFIAKMEACTLLRSRLDGHDMYNRCACQLPARQSDAMIDPVPDAMRDEALEALCAVATFEGHTMVFRKETGKDLTDVEWNEFQKSFPQMHRTVVAGPATTWVRARMDRGWQRYGRPLAVEMAFPDSSENQRERALWSCARLRAMIAPMPAVEVIEETVLEQGQANVLVEDEEEYEDVPLTVGEAQPIHGMDVELAEPVHASEWNFPGEVFTGTLTNRWGGRAGQVAKEDRALLEKLMANPDDIFGDIKLPPGDPLVANDPFPMRRSEADIRGALHGAPLTAHVMSYAMLEGKDLGSKSDEFFTPLAMTRINGFMAGGQLVRTPQPKGRTLFMMVPVRSSHWILCVYEANRLRVYDSLADAVSPDEVGWIVQWLHHWKRTDITVEIVAQRAQQGLNNDCGVFAFWYTLMLLSGRPVHSFTPRVARPDNNLRHFIILRCLLRHVPPEIARAKSAAIYRASECRFKWPKPDMTDKSWLNLLRKLKITEEEANARLGGVLSIPGKVIRVRTTDDVTHWVLDTDSEMETNRRGTAIQNVVRLRHPGLEGVDVMSSAASFVSTDVPAVSIKAQVSCMRRTMVAERFDREMFRQAKAMLASIPSNN